MILLRLLDVRVKQHSVCERYFLLTKNVVYKLNVVALRHPITSVIICVYLQITDMLLLNATGQVDKVMVALCINLATNSVNAQQMADNSRLHSLMSRAFSYQDALLMKMIRNISEHDSIRASFIVSISLQFLL